MNQITYSPEASSEKPQSEAPKLGRLDNIFVLLSFAVGFVFCEFILFGGFGVGVPLFFLVFYTIAGIYLSRKHNIFTKTSLISFVPVFLLLLCFAVFDNALLRGLNVIALWICTMLNLLAMAGLENRPMFWACTWYDILRATFYLPLHELGKRIAAFAESFKSDRRKNFVIVLLTLLAISPVAALVLVLLSNSDSGFASLMNGFNKLISAQLGSAIWKIIVSLLITFPIFNLLYALKHKTRPANHPLEGFVSQLGCIKALVTVSALNLFSLIYLVYISLQINYVFSAIRGVLPSSFTYAEYARRGFFELVAVAFINFCLIAFAVLLTKRENGRLVKSCRISTFILAFCTLVIIIAAASKMVMYMQNYGLTPMRIYTSWFMVLLGVLTLFTLIKMISPTFSFYKFAAVGAISLYLMLNLANVDCLIAKYNINLYHQSGKLDTNVFYDLSDSAIPEIAVLKNDPNYGKQISDMIKNREFRIKNMRWQDFSFSELALQQESDHIK